ncbi:F-box family protein [Rhynchospora pubera]|uniref:F-box family protein n=1 Tax=Rhynchospora pubera TaxID=906938 RepID=A0AAV8GSG4_9POAL|nr:F-box family protein [Rhynchospora pubera]KAJ4808580.1 F-box family protein [Rhynchospora pubera]
MVSWSDLTNDVLQHITSFLPFSDHYRFGAVCKNWRLVLKQRCCPPAPQLPWLVLEEESQTKKRKFYSLSDAKHYFIEIPELHGRYICGSSHGWLFAIDIKITGILINPFTRESYELPPFPAFSKNVDVTTLIEKVPSDYTGGPRDYTFEEMQVGIVWKAILSHDPKERSDFTAMILFGQKNNPAFWRPGDSSWTVVDGPDCRMEDVVCFKGNFYVISSMNELYVVDFEPVPKLIEVGPPIGKEGRPRQTYLLDFDGYMLLIERFCRLAEHELSVTVRFNVIEPNLEEDRLYEWFGVDDCAVFLGRNSSILVESSHLPMCRKNSIYFTHLTESYYGDEFGCYDLGIFNMTDETIDTFYSTEVFPPLVGSPVWLTPNPR